MPGSRYLTDFLVDNGTEVTYKGIPFAFPQSFGRTLFVNPAGNNATATVGRIDKPFATISAAIAASANNDSIWVFAGTYTENLIITDKTNLSFYLYDVTLTYSVANSNELIRSSNTNLFVYCFGKTTFTRTNQTTGGTYDGAISTPGSSALTLSNVTVSGNLRGLIMGTGDVFLEKVTINAGSGESFAQGTGNVTCYLSTFSTLAGQNNIFVGQGGKTAKFERCKMSGAATYSLRIGGDATGRCVFSNCEILSSASVAIRSDSTGYALFEQTYINSFTHVEIIFANAGLIFRDCTIIGKGATRAVWFYSAPADYTAEFINTKIISGGTYSIQNDADALKNKINMISCLVNKPYTNVAGVTANNITDSNLKDLR